MALTKIINDATQSFRPVLTDKLVLDATPTEGSYNGVTSDGVAKAIAEGGSSLEAGDGIAITDGEISAKVDGTSIGINASGELEALGGGASYTAGAGIAIDSNDTISVNHDNSLSDVAGTMPVEINGMNRTFKILPNTALTMDDTLTISSSSSAWASTGIGADQIPGYMRVKLTSASDSSKYVISTINCRKGNDEIYLDTTWSPYGMYNVNFDVYENAPLSYAFDWGSLTLADIGLTTGSGAYVTFIMCDSNGDQLGNDLSVSGLSATAWSVGSSAAPQKLSIANPVPSTNMVSSGSVLMVGSTGQPEWAAAPSGGSSTFYAEYNVTTYSDIAAAYAAGKTVIMSPFYSNQLCAYLMYIDSTIATFMCIDTNVNVASVNRFMVYAQSGSWANDTFTAVPYYDSTTDEGKVLKIVSGVPTWVTP